MVVGNHQCNAANLNQSKPQFPLELSLAQFSPSLFSLYDHTGLYKAPKAKKFKQTSLFCDHPPPNIEEPSIH